jgi:hypothetical protein
MIMQATIQSFRRKIGLAALVAIAPVVSGCVESHTPILTKAEPMFGPQFELHLYDTFIAGKARDVRISTYRWRNNRYERADQRIGDESEFVVQPIDEATLIVQTHDSENALFHYSVARKIADGAFLVSAIEEADVTPEIRAEICGNEQLAIICMIRTHDQLATLARATADKPPHNPMLGVIVRGGE